MFYSQIVLSKKGPLGKVWLAAHHEKRLTRPQIFSFDISQTVHDIAHPVVPLALRLSGHLLLGVVRIYSRKVNYLVEDAHDASIKIDTAFTVAPAPNQPYKLSGRRSAGGGGGGGGAGAGPGNTDRMDMAHFGDLHHHHAAFAAGGGFEIPTDLIPELEAWDEASTDNDDDNNNDHRGFDATTPDDGPSPRKRRRTDDPNSFEDSLEDVTPDEEQNAANLRSQLTTSAEAEDWGAFDPEDEDEDDFNNHSNVATRRKDSEVPEIETTRAADVSGSPDHTLRRSSGFHKEGGDDDDAEFPPPDDDYNDDNNAIPTFDEDDDEEATPGRVGGPRPSLAAALARDEEDALRFTESDGKGRLSSPRGGGLDDSEGRERQLLNDSDHTGDASRAKGVGGLDLSSDEELSHQQSVMDDAQGADNEGDAAAPKRRTGPTRKRKRRIAMDTGDTRMSADDIRRNLADASDLENSQPPPAAWTPGVEPSEQPPLSLLPTSLADQIREAMPLELYLARPSCADKGDMAPALLNFWLSNNAVVLGKAFPYELELDGTTVDESGDTSGEPEDGMDDDEAEVARRARAENDEEEEEPQLVGDNEEDDYNFPQPDDEGGLLSPGDDDGAIPFDDEDGAPPPPMDDEMEEPKGDVPRLGDSPDRRRLSSLSLGLVNDFVHEFGEDDDEEDDPRQDQGDTLASSASKWHKHTVKVFDMLRRGMPDDEPRLMSFDAICDPSAVTRRTACGVFFELLQLKTWDYIELDQDEFYGDVKISPGVKFNENPPEASRESMAGPSEAQAAAAGSP